MKKAISALLATGMVMSLAACGGSADTSSSSEATTTTTADTTSASDAAAAAEETDLSNVANDPAVTLVMAEVNPLDTIVGMTDTEFKNQVETLSGGSITIDLQGSGVLGNETDVLDGMMSGGDTVDIARLSAFALTSYGCTKATLLSLPFTFASRDHFWAFASSDLADEFLNEPQEVGLPVRGVYYGEEGFRHFFTKDAVSSMDDLVGMKLRVSNDPVMQSMVEALGGSPTVVSMTELYSALQTGVVDGAEQPIANYQSNAFPEVAPNLILDGHTLGAIQVIISDNAWNKLTEAQQAVIYQAGKAAEEYNQKISQEKEDEVLAELKEAGVNVVEVSAEEKAALQEKVASVVADNVGDHQDLYDQIEALA